MIIESLDIKNMKLTVMCFRDEILEIPAYIMSIIAVSEECGIRSLVLRHHGKIPPPIGRISETLVERNPWISIAEVRGSADENQKPGFSTISRTKNFLLLRDNDTDGLYSIIIPVEYESVDLASRTAYLVSSIMGFTGSTAYDVRFGVYEILMNVIEHDADADKNNWVQIQIEKRNRRLSVSIVEKSGEFDPTGEREFDLDEYVSRGKRRGLGLILMKRMYESFQYERKNGFNRILFDKALPSIIDGEKEDGMSSMEFGKFVDLGNGITKIELKGDLDAKGALVLESLMGELLEKKILKVILDLEKVPFVSSAGIGMLLGMTSTLRDEGGEVWFTRSSQQVLAVFALLNLDDFFLVMETEDAIIRD